jgi:hypothetical protein
MNNILLADGTELVPLEPKEKEALELEIKAVLEKYGASYLPIIKEERSITQITQKAGLLLLKKKEEGVPSPFIENGDNTNKETPETN